VKKEQTEQMEQTFCFKVLVFSYIVFLTSRLTSDFGVKNLAKPPIFRQFALFFVIFYEKTSTNAGKMCHTNFVSAGSLAGLS